MAPVDPPGFAEWWALYPRKVGKIAARKKYAMVLRDELATVDELEAGLARYVRYWGAMAHQRPGWDYIPHPSTWLHQGRWEDEVQVPRDTRTRGQRDRDEGWR